MGGNGKRWKISFYRSSSSSPRAEKKPPQEFICPISASLMADPVIVPSGHSFERACAQACKDLSFAPLLFDGSRPDLSALIPNIALRSTILNWCDQSGSQCPIPLQADAALDLVRARMEAEKDSQKTLQDISENEKGARENEKTWEENDEKEKQKDKTQEGIEEKEEEKESEKTQEGVEEKEREKEMLLRGVSENPQWKLSYAATEVNPRHKHLYSSSSNEEESVVVTPLPLATKPSCYSSSSATPFPNSTQKEEKEQEDEEEEFVAELKSSVISKQEEALIRLRSISRSSPEKRVPLCTPRLLAALRPLLASRYASIQTNAVAVIVNLSLETSNKVKIVRSGAVPSLIDALRSGFLEVQEHAAGAVFSLALEDENKTAIGVLGALPPLFHLLRSVSERGRQDAALAIYHLTLVQSNRSKLVKLGAVPTLLSLAREGELASRVLIILCNLASTMEGRVAMLDAGAVEAFVEMLKRKNLENVVIENCIAALFALSQSGLRFKGAAKAAGAVEVLVQVGERGTERARQKVKRMLMLLKEQEGVEEGDEEGSHSVGRYDWERGSDSSIGVYRQQQRYQLHKAKNITGVYSTEF